MGEINNLTGLWLKTGQKDGSQYMVGRLGYMRVMVLKNRHKQHDSEPDYNLVITAIDNQQDGGGGRQGPPAIRNNWQKDKSQQQLQAATEAQALGLQGPRYRTSAPQEAYGIENQPTVTLDDDTPF